MTNKKLPSNPEKRELMIRKLRDQLDDEQLLMSENSASLAQAMKDCKEGKLEDLSAYLRKYKDT